MPVLFSPVALFFLARARRSSSVTEYKMAYGLVLISAAASVTAYFTGPPAAEWLSGVLTLDQVWIEDHALWGRVAFTIMALAGAASLVALLAYWQDEQPHASLPWVVGGLTLLAFAAMVWTAHLGGLIRRPELRF